MVLSTELCNCACWASVHRSKLVSAGYGRECVLVTAQTSAGERRRYPKLNIFVRNGCFDTGAKKCLPVRPSAKVCGCNWEHTLGDMLGGALSRLGGRILKPEPKGKQSLCELRERGRMSQTKTKHSKEIVEDHNSAKRKVATKRELGVMRVCTIVSQ